MIGWRKDGTYTHYWLWIRSLKRLKHPSSDSKQLKYCFRYNRLNKFVMTANMVHMCTYFKLS